MTTLTRAADTPAVSRVGRHAPPGHVAPAWLALPVVLAAALSLWRAADRQLWLDEYATWWAATLNRRDFLWLIAHLDTVQAPYYVLIHHWMRLAGDSPLAMRTPSIVAFTAAVAFVVAIGRRMYNPAVGVLAGVLTATIPFLGLYAQTARPYAFAVLFAAAATYLLLTALDRPRSWWRWGLYAAAMALLGAFHLVAVMLLVSHAAGVWWALREHPAAGRAPLVGFAAAGAAALLALSPVVVRGHQQQGQIGGGARDVNEALFLMIYAFRAELAAAVLVWFAMLGLCLAGGRRAHRITLTVWATFPYALVIPTLDVLNLAKLRYLLFALPPWCVLAAAGICRLAAARPRTVAWTARAAVPLALVLMVPGHLELRRDPLLGYPDYRAAAIALADEARDGDGAAYYGDNQRIIHQQMFAYYLRRRGIELHGAFLAQSPRQAGNFDGAACADPTGCLDRYDRVWVITTADGPDPFATNMPARHAELFRTRYTVNRERRFTRVRILLLVRT